MGFTICFGVICCKRRNANGNVNIALLDTELGVSQQVSTTQVTIPTSAFLVSFPDSENSSCEYHRNVQRVLRQSRDPSSSTLLFAKCLLEHNAEKQNFNSSFVNDVKMLGRSGVFFSIFHRKCPVL